MEQQQKKPHQTQQTAALNQDMDLHQPILETKITCYISNSVCLSYFCCFFYLWQIIWKISNVYKMLSIIFMFKKKKLKWLHIILFYFF